MSLIDKLQWRAAIKQFDSTRKLTEEQVENLLDAVRLAPSGGGLQPYRIVVIENPEIKEQLREAANGQAQLSASSHVLVFAAETVVDTDYVAKYIDLMAATRQVPREQLAGFEKSMGNFINGMTEEQRLAWATKQAYIALGVLVSAAADMQIDACPMEGFQPGKFDEILGLSKIGLTSVVIAPIGYRADTDVYSKAAKVRRPADELFIRI